MANGVYRRDAVCPVCGHWSLRAEVTRRSTDYVRVSVYGRPGKRGFCCAIESDECDEVHGVEIGAVFCPACGKRWTQPALEAAMAAFIAAEQEGT